MNAKVTFKVRPIRPLSEGKEGTYNTRGPFEYETVTVTVPYRRSDMDTYQDAFESEERKRGWLLAGQFIKIEREN